MGYKYLQELNIEKEIFGFDSAFKSTEFQTLLRKSREVVKDDALFLYLYLNFFNLNKEEFFKTSKIKKSISKRQIKPFILMK